MTIYLRQQKVSHLEEPKYKFRKISLPRGEVDPIKTLIECGYKKVQQIYPNVIVYEEEGKFPVFYTEGFEEILEKFFVEFKSKIDIRVVPKEHSDFVDSVKEDIIQAYSETLEKFPQLINGYVMTKIPFFSSTRKAVDLMTRRIKNSEINFIGKDYSWFYDCFTPVKGIYKEPNFVVVKDQDLISVKPHEYTFEDYLKSQDEEFYKSIGKSAIVVYFPELKFVSQYLDPPKIIHENKICEYKYDPRTREFFLNKEKYENVKIFSKGNKIYYFIVNK